MAITVTIAQLQNDYANYLQKANPKISPRAPNSYWGIQGGAMAALFLDLYANLQLLENSIYPQNSVGDQVDFWLFTRGLTARGGQTYGTVIASIPSGTFPITILANTIFTDNGPTVFTNNQYQTFQEITVTANTDQFVLYAIQSGPNYLEPYGNELINATLGLTAQIDGSTNGQNEETDQSCISRILASIRVPKGGSRTTDYYEFALQSNTLFPVPTITDAIVEPDYDIQNQISILGLFPLVGTRITEYQLNQGLINAPINFIGYSRQISTGQLVFVNNYIQSQRLVGLSITVGANITYLVTATNAVGITSGGLPIINPPLAVNVSLASGFELTTILNINSQDQNNNPIVIQLTVEQLIQREARRAICNQQYGATKIPADTGQNYLTVDSIEYVLNFQLSANGGQLAQILTDVILPNGNIGVPVAQVSTLSLYFTYDIDSYTNIIVTVIS